MPPVGTPKRALRATSGAIPVATPQRSFRRGSQSSHEAEASSEDEPAKVPTTKLRAQREKNKAAQKAWRERKRSELDSLRSSASESQLRLRDLEMENVQLRERNKSLEAQLQLVKELARAQSVIKMEPDRMTAVPVSDSMPVGDKAPHGGSVTGTPETTQTLPSSAETDSAPNSVLIEDLKSPPSQNHHFLPLLEDGASTQVAPVLVTPSKHLETWLELADIGPMYKALAW
ncbi:hypothetical protein M427DRAFT_56327 [Gonapodya prolifera JEL478]|uniref:BZIP domain-containing protein n=1 Tax=Gonapodya prolifera (strain JEL478) TaxID=1344416 RepID=A0A139AGV4_GONPJ|nr:hypothetical protein M427DRAFT_56327 [Gonapodya prolifera JEL478]|eukprot:KXS16041.1 hypothetical protein M427DRAFT_56327 [Gonapodya prolifera JEL478]